MPTFGTIVMSGFLVLVGASGGAFVATMGLPEQPLACTIDPLLAEEIARQTALLERIASVADAFEARQQYVMSQAEHRRQQLQKDALRPGQPTGLDALPTGKEKK